MKKNLIMLSMVLVLLFSAYANADTIYLNINNENLISRRADGLWGEVTLTQYSQYRVDFSIDPYEDAFLSTSNFGIQTFGFNENTGATISIINLPSNWSSIGSKNLDGFGNFMMVEDMGSKGVRQDPLTFSVVSTDEIIFVSNFIVNNAMGYPFAAHIAGFTIEGSSKTSAWFSVPEPGILILLGIAMTAVGVATRYMRKP